MSSLQDKVAIRSQREHELWETLRRKEILVPAAIVATYLSVRALRDAGILDKDEAGLIGGLAVYAIVASAGGSGTVPALAALGSAGLTAVSLGQEWPTLYGIGGGAATGAAIGSVIPGVGTLVGAGVGAGIGGLAGALTD